MNILQVKGIHKIYGEKESQVHALRDVSFSVKQGEFIAIVGTSGSGKSTLLNLIGGLDTPTKGQIIIRGHDIAALKPKELTIFRRRNIGFVFQNYNLVPVLNVYENVVLPIELDGEEPDKKYVEEIIETLGIKDKIYNLPNQLSGGQQQRVAIARALASKPAILLADEPTGNLDSRTSQEVLGLLKLTNSRFSQTIVMITHSEELAQLCDRIIRIEDGTNWAYLTSRTENLDPETLVLLAGAFLVILITGYLIIYNIFQLSILKEIRFYGLLKTVGTTKKQLKNLVYRQVWKLSAVGIPLGLVLGFLAGQLLIPFLTRFSGYEGTGGIYFSPWIFVFGALFSLATVFISCRKPARIAGKVSPIEAIRYTEGGVKRRRKKKGQKGGRISRMALANLGRNKKKTLIVVLSLSFSIILLEVVMTGVGSFRMDQYLEARLVGDYMIGNANFTRASPITSDFSIDETYLAGADSQPGILETGELWTDLGIRHTLSETGRRRYEKLYEEGKMYTEQKSIREAALRAIEGKGRIAEQRYAYSDSLLSKLKAVAGTIDLEKFATGDYVLVQQFDSEGNDRASIYEPGDRITLSYPTENSEQIMETDDKGEVTDWYYTNTKEKEYQVMAVIEPLPNSMNMHMFSANALTVVVSLEDVKASSNGILFAKSYRVQEEDQPAFASYLENYTQQVNSSMGYLSKDSLEKEFSGMVNAVAAVGYSLCAVIAIIGLLNFANSMLTGILSRNQELAAMQSIGMTKGQIRKMLLWESGYYILVSGVVSIVLGSVGAYYLVSALNNVVLCFQYRYTPWPFILMIPLCAVIAAGISLAAYQQTQRKSVVERLRESE